MAAEARFRAMGSDCHIVLVGGRVGALARARAHVDELERSWSRFIECSEVSMLNSSSGRRLRVSQQTFDLVRLAVEGCEATGGLFDPTVLRALEASGYDRSFELIDAGTSPLPELPATGCDG